MRVRWYVGRIRGSKLTTRGMVSPNNGRSVCIATTLRHQRQLRHQNVVWKLEEAHLEGMGGAKAKGRIQWHQMYNVKYWFYCHERGPLTTNGTAGQIFFTPREFRSDFAKPQPCCGQVSIITKLRQWGVRRTRAVATSREDSLSPPDGQRLSSSWWLSSGMRNPYCQCSGLGRKGGTVKFYSNISWLLNVAHFLNKLRKPLSQTRHKCWSWLVCNLCLHSAGSVNCCLSWEGCMLSQMCSLQVCV